MWYSKVELRILFIFCITANCFGAKHGGHCAVSTALGKITPYVATKSFEWLRKQTPFHFYIGFLNQAEPLTVIGELPSEEVGISVLRKLVAQHHDAFSYFGFPIDSLPIHFLQKEYGLGKAPDGRLYLLMGSERSLDAPQFRIIAHTHPFPFQNRAFQLTERVTTDVYQTSSIPSQLLPSLADIEALCDSEQTSHRLVLPYWVDEEGILRNPQWPPRHHGRTIEIVITRPSQTGAKYKAHLEIFAQEKFLSAGWLEGVRGSSPMETTGKTFRSYRSH